MKQTCFVLVLSFLLVAFIGISRAADSVYVERIDGLDVGNGLMAQTPIRFHFRYEVDSGTVVTGVQNGFHVMSPDAAVWEPISGVINPSTFMIFDFWAYFNEYSIDGQGADSVDLILFSLNTPHLTSVNDGEIFYLETILAEDQLGKHICIDTAPPANSAWIWGTLGDAVYPSWGGPYCFEIVDCCVGNRGDINADGVGPNILDLTSLVDFLFRGASAPICKSEADVNSDGSPHNILDLIYIVDYMHRGGPAPESCP